MVKVGGATGAFASEQGLVLSNQHVAFGVIQYNSNAGRNLIDDGFVAASPAEELPANPDFRLRVTVGFEPVTDQVLANARGKTGRTNRYRLADEVQSSIDWTYPTQIKACEDTLNVINTAGKAAPKVAVKYASMVASLNNYLKNFGGQLEGLRRADAVNVKRAQEAQLEAWLKQQGGADNAALVTDIGKLRQAIAADQTTRERSLDLGLDCGLVLVGDGCGGRVGGREPACDLRQRSEHGEQQRAHQHAHDRPGTRPAAAG